VALERMGLSRADLVAVRGTGAVVPAAVSAIVNRVGFVEAGYRAGRYHVATNRACTRLGGPVASPLEPGLICAWAVLGHLQPERADHTRSVAQPPRGIPMTREGSGVRRPYAGKSAS
jgi:hypothetical protein